MRSLVSDIGYLQQRVCGQAALNRKVPLLVVKRPERGRIRAGKILADRGKQALRTPWGIEVARRERIAHQSIRVDAIERSYPRGGSGERAAGKCARGPVIWHAVKNAVSYPNNGLVIQGISD